MDQEKKQEEPPKEKTYRFVSEYNADNSPKAFIDVKESELTLQQSELLAVSLWNRFHGLPDLAQDMFIANLVPWIKAKNAAEDIFLKELEEQQKKKIILP